jgi:hypothetical protein
MYSLFSLTREDIHRLAGPYVGLENYDQLIADAGTHRWVIDDVYEHLVKLAPVDQGSSFLAQTDPEQIRTWLEIQHRTTVSVTSLVLMSVP